MSSQKGGILEMSQSFNFNRDTTNNLRGKTIDSAGFSAWDKDNMYKSTYAQFHSSVSFFISVEFNITKKYSNSGIWRFCPKRQSRKYPCQRVYKYG